MNYIMQIKIEKLVFGGQGLCRSDGKVVFVWGGLPGEEVEIKIIKKKKNFIEGVVEKVLVPSPDRVAPLDDHYLSCSPWQTMSYAKENEWKKIIAEETYKRIAGLENLNLEIIAPKKEIGYRNKMEYNFVSILSGTKSRIRDSARSGIGTVNQHEEVSLAFHDRGTHWLRPIERCSLGTEIIQKASEQIVDNLRQMKVPVTALKSLVVRSDDSEKASAALFVKDRNFVKQYPFEVPRDLKGLQIYYSNPLSPASIPTELLFSSGESGLECKLNGVKLKFGLMSFFQINVSIFEEALNAIGKHLDGGRVVDYYSGVGAISLALHGKYREAMLIEENDEASKFAEENIKLNNFSNVSVLRVLAEKSFAETRLPSPSAQADGGQVGEDDMVILDPPRAGLHTDMIKYLLKKQPRKIIYLSCGLDTHARDISFLSVKYRPVDWKLFNFFPRTPHIEGLCVLGRH